MASSNMKIWEFHPAMILKKYKHCPHCGEKLVHEKYTRVVTKEDDDFNEYYQSGKWRGENYIGLEEIHVATTRYTCPACNKSYTYDELRECVKSDKNNRK